MTVTYIFHSGFLVETPSAVLIFDYFKDPAGVFDRCERMIDQMDATFARGKEPTDDQRTA